MRRQTVGTLSALLLVLLGTCSTGHCAPARTTAGRQAANQQYTPAQTHGCLTIRSQPDVSREAIGKRTGSLLVLVNGGLYKDLKGSIATYTSDLARQGYQTNVKAVTVTLSPLGDLFFMSYRDLKWLLRDWWLSLLTDAAEGKLGLLDWIGNSGVVLVGDFPIPLVHGRVGHWVDDKKGTSGCYEGNFVCDLFLTDLNGNWNTVDGANMPLYSTVDTVPAPDAECVAGDEDDAKWLAPPDQKLGKAGARPEIFLGRISPGKLCNGNRAAEVQLINEYFARNHDYRMGKWANSIDIPLLGTMVGWPRLAYYDDDWVSSGEVVAKSMLQAWPGIVVANPPGAPDSFTTSYVSDNSLTTKADYMSRLQNTQWLWVDFLAHSSPAVHEMHVGGQHENLWNTEVAGANFKSLFYWLQGCDTSDLSRTNNLGTVYLFRNKALAVAGNTSVGPLDTGQFYASLGWGQTIGQAFMVQEWKHGQADWVPNIAQPGTLDPKRYYQWVLLGDPTLPVLPPSAPQYQTLLRTTQQVRSGLLDTHLNRETPAAFAARLGTSVRRLNTTSTRENATVVRRLKPGMTFLEVAEGRPVIDPAWRMHVSRGVTLDVRPNLREFRPLREVPSRDRAPR